MFQCRVFSLFSETPRFSLAELFRIWRHIFFSKILQRSFMGKYGSFFSELVLIIYTYSLIDCILLQDVLSLGCKLSNGWEWLRQTLVIDRSMMSKFLKGQLTCYDFNDASVLNNRICTFIFESFVEDLRATFKVRDLLPTSKLRFYLRIATWC